MKTKTTVVVGVLVVALLLGVAQTAYAQPPDWLKTPKCTYWHEIWPVISNMYHLSSWEDGQEEGEPGHGILSACDQIDLTDLTTNEKTWWHVERVSTDIWISRKIAPYDCLCLDKRDEPYIIEPGNPECTWWHELWPVYCREWHIQTWEDNDDGILSRCDQIKLQDHSWWHVDKVTITITLKKKPYLIDIMYVEHIEYKPVGGISFPVDKLALLAPYIALAVAVVAVTLGAASARKHWLGKTFIPRP